jgi:hypothetical protein
MPETSYPTPQELKFLNLIKERENHQCELREGAEKKDHIVSLEKRGYIRLNPAFIMPFKSPTGTYFAVLTEAGYLALLYSERELNLSQPCSPSSTVSTS